MFKRVVFYTTDSQVYHIIPGGERDYRECTLCGWDWSNIERPDLYNDVKVGPYIFEKEGELIWGLHYHRLCKRCAQRLPQCPQIPFDPMLKATG